MTFNAFDVIVVPFPFTDRDTTKRRPALVISNALFNQQHDQLILAMITTTDNVWPSDVPLVNWQDVGLKVSCHLRLKLFTLDQNLIIRTVGHLSSQDIQAVQATLSKYLNAN